MQHLRAAQEGTAFGSLWLLVKELADGRAKGQSSEENEDGEEWGQFRAGSPLVSLSPAKSPRDSNSLAKNSNSFCSFS